MDAEPPRRRRRALTQGWRSAEGCAIVGLNEFPSPLVGCREITVLLSHLHKFIFTRTNKAAGTSVEVFFEVFCAPEDSLPENHGRDETITEEGIIGFRGARRPEGCRFWNHMPALRLKELVGDETWNDYFKFTTVRNPYDKVVSQFYFHKFLKSRGGPKPEFGDPSREREDFAAWLEVTPISHDKDKYLIDGRFCLDDVIRFESLRVDIERVAERLGISRDIRDLRGFKRGIRPSEAKPWILYTDATRRKVADIYAFELEHFGYAFPEEDP